MNQSPVGRIYKLIMCSVVVGAILFVVGFCFLRNDGFPELADNKWQAVFLENNQVYFGKLTEQSKTYVTLTQVYYLRGAGLGDGANAQAVDLVKLGGEFHGPEDMMYIPKSKIVFWENLKEDSRIVQFIKTSAKP